MKSEEYHRLFEDSLAMKRECPSRFNAHLRRLVIGAMLSFTAVLLVIAAAFAFAVRTLLAGEVELLTILLLPFTALPLWGAARGPRRRWWRFEGADFEDNFIASVIEGLNFAHGSSSMRRIRNLETSLIYGLA